MFERFTDRARRVLVLAQEEAALLGHNYIGTEHILLGLIHEGEGVAAKALESLGVDLGDMRSHIEVIIGPRGSEPSGPPPFTPRAKKVLELALREALQLGHNYIGTEHMLLGLVREGEGVAAQVLVAQGVALAEVRQKVIVLLGGYTGGKVMETASGVTATGLTATGGEEAAQKVSTQPGCQHCRAPMAAHARSRFLLVPDDEGGPAIETTVVYCSACGRGIGAHVEAGPRPTLPDLPA